MLEVYWGDIGGLQTDVVIKIFIDKGNIDRYEVIARGKTDQVFKGQAVSQEQGSAQDIMRKIAGRALQQVESLKLPTVAFQLMSSAQLSGSQLAEVLVAEVRRHLAAGSGLEKVVFVLTDQAVYDSFKQMINRNVIVCLGDSITYGYPYGPEVSWVKLLEDKLGFVMINKGVNGDTLTQMASRFQWDVSDNKPAVVIILGGTNDAFMGVASESVQSAISFMVEQSFAAGICPVLGLPVAVSKEGILSDVSPDELQMVDAKLETTRNWIKEYASKHNLPVLDFYNPLLISLSGIGDPRYFVDGYHPNQSGYRELSVKVEKMLICLLDRMGVKRINEENCKHCLSGVNKT